MIPKPPFKLPVRVEECKHGYVLLAADSELVCSVDEATPPEQEFIVAAINHYGEYAAATEARDALRVKHPALAQAATMCLDGVTEPQELLAKWWQGTLDNADFFTAMSRELAVKPAAPTIYRAVIEWDEDVPYESNYGVEWEAYGADMLALADLMKAKAMTIAPDADWECGKFENGQLWSKVTIPAEVEASIPAVEYTAYLEPITLVC